MSSSIDIIRLNIADIAIYQEQLLQIYQHYVTHATATFEIELPSAETFSTRLLNTIENGYPLLIAVQNNVVLGYAYLGSFRAREGYRYVTENSIYLAPDATGKGIGKLLLGKLIELAKQGPWKHMIAVLGGDNMLPSRKLHEALGFKEVGLLPKIGAKHDKHLDVLLLQLSWD